MKPVQANRALVFKAFKQRVAGCRAGALTKCLGQLAECLEKSFCRGGYRVWFGTL